jgi:uncharacterized protein (UPF0276 family)
MAITAGSEPRVDLPELGVGITFSSAVEPVLEHHPDLVDVVEIEPQTTWLDTGAASDRYRQLDDVASYLKNLPFRKLVHSIGLPVGGTGDHDPNQIALLRDTIAELKSPWASEHLSFNHTESFQTGFFLPPRQTDDGVAVAVESICRLRADLGVPLAIETGVNYLAARPDEMTDGEFVATVAERADCGILLDLHNIYTNAVNGRQAVEEFVAQLPLARIWEIHLAGGFWMDGYWLDAHSGAIPGALFDQAKEIVSGLPHLGAIIFEIYPSFVDSVGVDEICRQLDLLRELWSVRGRHADTGTRARPTYVRQQSGGESASPAVWEMALGSLVIGRSPEHDLETELSADSGVALLQKLALEFRASMIASNLRRTTRLLLLALGEDVFRMLLAEYRRRVTPQMFAATEARAFAGFLRDLGVNVPQLAEVMEFEVAVLETLVDGQARLVRFDFDPLPMLLALSDGRLPDEPGRAGRFEIEITPDTARALERSLA